MISVRADHGGGPAHMLLLTKKLADQFEVYAALPEEEPYWDRFAELIGKSHLLSLPHRSFQIGSLVSLCRSIGERKINIIHSHGKGAGIYGRFAGIFTGVPTVHTFHGVHIGQYGRIGRRLYLGLERILGRLTRTIIAVSAGEQQQMLSLHIAKPEKIKVIENGIEIPEEIIDKQVPVPPLSITTITRFDYAKNPELLAEVIRRLADSAPKGKFIFEIIGDGEGRKDFEHILGEYSNKDMVMMHGFINNPDTVLQRTWLYLSTSRWESFGLGVAEALVRGVPVLATNVTGSRDLVENDRNGWLFSLDRPEEAVNTIIEISNNTHKYKLVAQYALTTGRKRFSADVMADSTAAIYMALIKDKRKGI